QGQFTTLDFPGAPLTEPTAINNRGEIVGQYEVASSVFPFDEFRVFVYRNGQFSKVTLPGDGQSQTANINNRGEIVGTYLPSGCGNTCTEVHGFLAVPSSAVP